MTEEDEALVARIRPLLGHRSDYSEKRMFGGVCCMINGNMCVGPWKGSLIVRLSRDEHEQTLSEPFAQPMDITGKVMRGWARIEPEGIADDADLESWVRRAEAFVEELPPKPPKD